MNIIRKVHSRINRGFSLARIGPNEARFVYDFVAATACFAAVQLFSLVFFSSGILLTGFAMPVLLMLANSLGGVYTRFKTARGIIKGVVLFVSITLVTFVGWFILPDGSQPFAVLWGMMTVGPLILPRLFLSLTEANRKGAMSIAVRQRGPVLVVGGGGYIGTHVVDVLLKAKHQVRVLDSLMFGIEPLSEFMDNPAFEFLEGDVTDITKLTEAMNGVSAVVHLAGLVGDPACSVDDEFTRHANIISTRMAKNVASSLGIYRFIFASSCSVYGASDVIVNEDDPLNPVSLYARTKIDSEKELLFSVKDDFIVTILRFSTVFGHSRRPRFDLVTNLFTAQAMDDGKITVFGPKQMRPFVHVHDLARAVLSVLNSDPDIVQSQIFNVGDRRLNMSILDMAKKVQAVVVNEYGKEVDIAIKEDIDDPRNYMVSFAKIRRDLGFECETMMEDGIREMADLLRDGSYEHFRSEKYSNVVTTEKALTSFQDPLQSTHLYGPLKFEATSGDN